MERDYIIRSYDVLHWDEKIKMLFDEGASLQIARHYIIKNRLNALLTYYFTLYPSCKCKSWTGKDYDAAADFFKTEYPITKEFVSLKLDEIVKVSYNHIIEAYRKLSFDEGATCLS